MTNLKRSLGFVVAFALLPVALTACAPAADSNTAVTARDMIASDATLMQPAGPQLQDSPVPEESAPVQTATPTPEAKKCSEMNLISSNSLMSVSPYAEPKKFRDFSKQGAANVVAYYTYAAYYGFIDRKTDIMRRVFTKECSKCVKMADWIDGFVAKNARIETGVPATDIIDVYSEKTDNRSIYWVVAQNREPAIVGCSAEGTHGDYDSPSTGKSLYRVEFVEGKNQITGIFKAPDKYL